SIENMLQELSNEIEHLDVLIQEHIKTHPELNQDFRLLTSIKSAACSADSNEWLLSIASIFNPSR
ncbi:hypothetical protein QJA14_25565, partial [Escherichia coli]